MSNYFTISKIFMMYFFRKCLNLYKKLTFNKFLNYYILDYFRKCDS